MSERIIELFRWVLEASWQASLIIFLILCLRPLLGAAIPARYRPFLWALVMIRLLVPVSLFPQNPACIQNIAAIDNPIETAGFAPPAAEEIGFVQPQGPREGQEFMSGPFSPAEHAKKSVVPWWTVAAAIWFAGVVAGLAFLGIAHVGLWRRLRKDSAPVSPAILAVWDRCRTRLHVRRPVLLASPAVTSPALVGLFRPVLFVPKASLESFSEEDWEHIFTHELAHYRRDDHWTNAVYLVALVVHWFNPLVWLGYRQLRADRELAADEWALRNLKEERSGAYGDTLLKVLAQSSAPRLSMVSVGILEDRTQLKQRLQRIGGFRPRTLLASALGAAVVVAVTLLVIGQRTEKADFANYKGFTPEETLAAAAMDGDLPVVKKMVLGIPKADAPAKLSPALSKASGAGYLDVVRYLVQHGADMNPKKGYAPVVAAWKNGYGDCAEYLLQQGAVCEPGMVAAGRGDKAGVEKAITQTPPLSTDQLKEMCNVAAANGKVDAYSKILESIRQRPGESNWEVWQDLPILVVARGHREMVQRFIDNGETFNKGSVTRLSGALSKDPGMKAWMASKGFTAPEYNNGEKLIDAAAHGDMGEMQRLLNAGTDINYYGESSWRPVLYAAAWNNVRSVKFLLDHGADPNAEHLPGYNYTGYNLTTNPEIAAMFMTAGAHFDPKAHPEQAKMIDYPIGIGSTKLVAWYLDHGVDPNVQTTADGQTLLFRAPNPEIAELLIAYGIDVNARDKRSGETALMQICNFARSPAETARVLLKHGADPNARNNYGSTPLMLARDGATVDVLVEYGADIHVKDKNGKGLLEMGRGQGDSTLIEAFIRHGLPFDPKTGGPTMLLHAAWRNQVSLMGYLLDHGVDPNTEGLWGTYNGKKDMMLPLTAAAVSGQYDAAKLLVEHGAKADEHLMVTALQNRRSSMIKLFWEHGMRLISPLCYAVSQGAPVDQLQKLLDEGSPVDPPEDKVMPPLSEAAVLGDFAAVKFLVEHGANVNGGGLFNPKLPQYRESPLRLAAFEGQDEIVAYLLQHGAKPDVDAMWSAVNDSTPYGDERSKEHFEKTVQLFIDAGTLKGISKSDEMRLLLGAIFTRQGPGNQTVIKMLLDAGLSLQVAGKDGKSVIEVVREASKQPGCATPSKEMMVFLEKEAGPTKDAK